MSIIEAAYWLIASEETGNAQKGLKMFKDLIINCQEHILNYKS